MAVFGFEESTIALLLIFAFFILVVYSIIRLVLKVVFIAIISMAFPVILSYLGIYKNVNIDTMVIFGILGSLFYIIYFFVNKALGIIWGAIGMLEKKEKPAKHKKRQKPKKEQEGMEEVEIPEQ
ncbi:MAG: hypothetical protein HY051_06120 [Candidatus Aenigmarchaeota archaeon]|nr:hypothetical protein [Candidatus Aenigmarchaeota archaeon]